MEKYNLNRKSCRKCGIEYPITKDFFGHTPSGGFRNTCRECQKKYTTTYTKLNPDEANKRWSKRYEKIKSQGSLNLSKEQIDELLRKLDNRCAYCDTPLESKYEIEHMTPISRGGQNDIKNITLACYACNKEKHKKTFIEFIKWRKERNLPVRRKFKL